MKLDHVNIRVRNLAVMSRFYVDILSLTVGHRPPFSGAPGAWLYDDTGHPVVHLSTISTSVKRAGQNLDHIAFRTDDLAQVMKRLKSNGVEFEIDEVPETDIVQIFFRDPEGGRVEVSGPGPRTELTD